MKKFNACQRISATIQSTLEQLQQQTRWGGPANEAATKGPVPTVSGQVQEDTAKDKDWKYDVKRDNFGLYALKCDRSAAKRGLVLNITRPVKLPNSVQRRRLSPDLKKQDTPCEMNHEKFEPVCRTEEIIEKPIKSNRIQPPPRRKRKSTLGSSQDTLNYVPEVPTDLTVHPDSQNEDLATITTNVKEMCRQFEREPSVDIFTQPAENFADFDHIFGPSPCPPEEKEDERVEVAKAPKEKQKKKLVRKLVERFSSSDSDDLQYFKRGTPVQREVPEKSPSKVDKIIFQDRFVPNSFDPPKGESQTFTTNEGMNIIPTSPSVGTVIAKAAEIAEESAKCNADNITHDDQLTISRHYLNEDVLVWTF